MLRMGVAEDENLPADAALPQFDALQCGCHAESLYSQLLQLLCDHRCPVAVGVCFENRHQLTFLRQQGAELTYIVPQIFSADFNPRPALLESGFSKKHLSYPFSMIRAGGGTTVQLSGTSV